MARLPAKIILVGVLATFSLRAEASDWCPAWFSSLVDLVIPKRGAPIQRVVLRKGHGLYSEVELAKKPVLIDEKEAWQVIGGTEEHPVARAASLLYKKYDAGLYVQELDQSKMLAFATEDQIQKLSLVLPPHAGTSRFSDLPLVAHETTHISNTFKRNQGKLRSFFRTAIFEGWFNSSFARMSSTYQKYFRADEVHARAVQTGVMLKQAEKLLRLNRNPWKNVPMGRHLLASAESEMAAAEKFMKAADEELALFREELKKKPGAAARHLEKLEIRRPDPGANGGAFTVSFNIKPEEALRLRTEEDRAALAFLYLDEIQADMHRFEKTFAHFRTRAAALEIEAQRSMPK